ncbi:MAG: hypothetical protein JNK70_14940, partial [Phycisphaerae bacterium]|nr:hypothetical protein [Phycisphaerae bacterium]
MTQTRMEQGRAVPEQIIDPDAIAFELEAADRHAELAAAYVRTAGTLAEPGQSVVLAQAAFAYREAALNIARAVLGQPDRHDAADLL